MIEDSEYWARYYDVTVDRPAWATVREAIAKFRREDEAAASGRSAGIRTPARFAVDLGCGAGRDTRELLRAGWRVLAIDREANARSVLETAVEPDLRGRLEIRIDDVATAAIPACDLVNASLCLPFLAPEAFQAAWDRIVSALGPGARFAAMLFGDRDDSAADPEMTCLPPERIRSGLAGFEIELWSEKEEDSQTALGEPHHFHLVEFVARRTA
jgi:tellurite methyltransferase